LNTHSRTISINGNLQDKDEKRETAQGFFGQTQTGELMNDFGMGSDPRA